MTENQATIRDGIATIISEIEPGIRQALDNDRDAYLRLIAVAAEIDAEAGGTLRDSVLSARAAGLSWENVGDVLDISRQAAQQRFGTPALPADGRVLRMHPVTAFDEMERLDEVGKHGWHSVGFGTLYHDLVHTDRQWEHRRVSVFGSRSALEAEGWQRIGTMWIPWAYYARPTDKPALPDPAKAS
ncbi:hypothetical protein [Frigoribacterium sp. PvP032]|uniref:hypothetical protein n=1 Tax=Frigoribacterium sp. PvP032 TaxID=2806589 RepID=UPI001AE26DD1|nr:hypothetical protein [Frigoribacterium sp. PvP032]MBP1189803.1 hypothetical protein [Frigoribacterium sp. PvP032]